MDAPATKTDRLNAALAGRYRIERHLGEGGMATVYLAEDLRHKRRVAIKLLKPELAAVLGADRFVQEITTTASLQHPHILPLFDSGTADGFLFYVMPFIEGETLRDKLNRETQLSVDEAVRIAREVADALDYAHRHGVIHRDIKPENILLHDGRPMVADFGIALAVSAAAGGRMTETGLSLGTPHYMSPEQATAEKEITARSDIYSIGSVLYEMLTGSPPHTGANAQQIIMKIISEPAEPVTKYRKSVPPNVAAAVAKAVEKLPADRFESAKAFVDALQNTAFTTATQAHVVAASGWKARAIVPLASASVILAAALGWQTLKPKPEPAPMRYDLTTTAAEVMVNSDVVISPDGSMLAYTGITTAGTGVYLRRLGVDIGFQKVSGTDSALTSPAFSPDNQWLVLRKGNEFIKVSLVGGGTQRLTRVETAIGNFPDWGPNNRIVYSGGPGGLVRISADGAGALDTVAGSRGAARYSHLLPDGSGILFSRASGIYLLDFRTDSATRLLQQGTHPVYAESGHLLYIAEDGLFAVPFDLAGHRITGAPVRAVERVAAALGKRGFSVSRNGTLVYEEGPSALAAAIGNPTVLLMGEFGGRIDTLRLPRGRRLQPRFSPDGRQVAFEAFLRGGSSETDVVTFDLVAGTMTRLTFSGDNDDPVWSPDGKRIVFTRTNDPNGEDLFVKAADNSGSEQMLFSERGGQNPTAWISPDTILVQSTNGPQMDLFTFSLQSSRATPYLQGPWFEGDVHVSPDGKLAAFVSQEGGNNDVWLRDFPVPNGKWQVSATGGRMPRWSPDGKDLYYWRQGFAFIDSLYRVRIDRTPSVRVNSPQLVLTHDIISTEGWDIHPDGKRFVMVQLDVPRGVAGPGAPTSRYVIIPNWFTELRAKTAGSKK